MWYTLLIVATMNMAHSKAPMAPLRAIGPLTQTDCTAMMNAINGVKLEGDPIAMPSVTATCTPEPVITAPKPPQPPSK